MGNLKSLKLCQMPLSTSLQCNLINIIKNTEFIFRANESLEQAFGLYFSWLKDYSIKKFFGSLTFQL